MLDYLNSVATAKEQPYLSTCPSCDTKIDVTALEPFTKLKCLHCGEMVRVRRKFDHFVIVKQIGEGGMSRVFEAEDETLGRRVALKILNREYSRNAERVEQFRREALITANVNHPNVIKLYTVGYDQGYFYIAMELVGGGSLEQRIRNQGKIPEQEALRIGHEVAEGLRAAQRMGLVHRDVKPANILFTETGTAKVVDFGLALFIQRDVDDSGEIWATPFYVAPEKVLENSEDHRSDIFSLGASLFHALTGKPPHNANTNSLSELRLIKCRRVTLEDSGLHFGARTNHVVNQMLAFKPEDRFQSYDEAIDELRFAEGLVGHSILRRGSKRTRVVAGTVTAILAAFAIGWVLRDSREKRANTIVAEPALIDSELVGGGVTLQVGGQTTADRFIRARDVLLQGKFNEARRLFEEVLNAGARQPTLNWARFNTALCSIVTGRREDALRMFDLIEAESAVSPVGESGDLSHFFSKVGKLMGNNLGLGSDLSKLAFDDRNEELMGWLALGMAEWHFGDPREGADSITHFLNGKVEDKALEWVPRYRVMVEPYSHDIQVVKGLKKGKPKNMEEANAFLAEIQKAKSSLQTKGNIVNILGRAESAIQRDIAKFRLEEQRKEMAASIERQKRELSQLNDLLEAIPALVEGYDFEAAVQLLGDVRFEAPEVQIALNGRRYLYSSSKAFVSQLLADINAKGFQGKIERRGAVALEGVVVKADGKELKLSISRGVISVPFETVAPESLIQMAQAFCSQVTDSTYYYRRQELIAAFARVEGSSDAATMAAQLMEENRDFRNRWMQVLQGGI